MFINVKDKVLVTTKDGNKYDGIINHIVLQPSSNDYDTVIFIEQKVDSLIEPFGIAAIFLSQIDAITILDNSNENVTMQDSNLYSKKIRTLMDKKNITRYRLSKMTGISDTQLRRLLSGENKDPRISTVKAIATALEVDLREII